MAGGRCGGQWPPALSLGRHPSQPITATTELFKGLFGFVPPFCNSQAFHVPVFEYILLGRGGHRPLPKTNLTLGASEKRKGGGGNKSGGKSAPCAHVSLSLRTALRPARGGLPKASESPNTFWL